jgi:hypothetical protein
MSHTTRTYRLAVVAAQLAHRARGVTALELALAIPCELLTAQRTLRKMGRLGLLCGTRQRGGRVGSYPIVWREVTRSA